MVLRVHFSEKRTMKKTQPQRVGVSNNNKYRDDRPVSLKCSTTESSLMPSSAGVEAEPVAEAKTGPVTAVLSLYLLEERDRSVGLCLRFMPDDWMVAPFSVNVVS